MNANTKELQRGDVIQVMYQDGSANLGFRKRWIRATVTYCEAGTWPIAKLVDGQFTEVRPFMAWRLVRPAIQGH